MIQDHVRTWKINNQNCNVLTKCLLPSLGSWWKCSICMLALPISLSRGLELALPTETATMTARAAALCILITFRCLVPWEMSNFNSYMSYIGFCDICKVSSVISLSWMGLLLYPPVCLDLHMFDLTTHLLSAHVDCGGEAWLLVALNVSSKSDERLR